MKVTLWGVQGNIPAPFTTAEYDTKLRAVLLQANGVPLNSDEQIDGFIGGLPEEDRRIIGGNTCCVEVSDGETLLVLDAGSGMRRLGLSLMGRPGSMFPKGQGVAHILFSHHHHDHTCGFAFFIPAYIPGNNLHFYGLHGGLEERMVGLQVQAYFPIPFQVMASKKFFYEPTVDETFEIGKFKITPFLLKHPGDAYGFRVEWGDKVFVFASDSEYKNPSQEEIDYFVGYFKDADLLYFDAQYTLFESFVKEDWGHSSALIGVDFAVQANVKRLILGQHDPSHSEVLVKELHLRAEHYRDELYPDSKLEILIAREDDTFDFS
ncbi:MAG: MBL fold metallo-hydrolase [Candidatus Poribacteria bacterium]|nr:MBL fold metallo-hydrolase [Candidatus Poribacteria bacterium]